MSGMRPDSLSAPRGFPDHGRATRRGQGWHADVNWLGALCVVLRDQTAASRKTIASQIAASSLQTIASPAIASQTIAQVVFSRPGLRPDQLFAPRGFPGHGRVTRRGQGWRADINCLGALRVALRNQTAASQRLLPPRLLLPRLLPRLLPPGFLLADYCHPDDCLQTVAPQTLPPEHCLPGYCLADSCFLLADPPGVELQICGVFAIQGSQAAAALPAVECMRKSSVALCVKGKPTGGERWRLSVAGTRPIVVCLGEIQAMEGKVRRQPHATHPDCCCCRTT